MSIINKSVTNEQVIPVVKSSIFESCPDARFALGILAIEDVPLDGLENEYEGYFDLRRKVYVDQTGQLHESELAEDGTDRDQDDCRSVAFGVIENRITDHRVVAAARLIIKGFGQDNQTNRLLPVEEFCPEIFGEVPIPAEGVEVSRLIARHENAGIQKVLQWKIYAATLGYIANHELGPTYAVVEPWLERHLKGTIPVSRIGEPRYIEHYLDYNLPIQVHTDQFVDQMNMSHPGLLDDIQQAEGSMKYFGSLVPAQYATEFAERRSQNTPTPSERRNLKTA